jgi:hypothetical protein
MEDAAGVARTEARHYLKPVDSDLRPKVALDLGERVLDSVRLRLKSKQRRELRQAAGAAVIDHEFPSDGLGEVGTVVGLRHDQRQIDACPPSYQSSDGAIDDEDTVLLQALLQERACIRRVCA